MRVFGNWQQDFPSFSGKLLSFPCKLDAQCQGRVAHSLCVQGHCACSRGTVAFHRHTCVKGDDPLISFTQMSTLPKELMCFFPISGASLEEVCYSNQQCHLKDPNTFCQFILRNVFGRCKCEFGTDPRTGKCKSQFKGTNVDQWLDFVMLWLDLLLAFLYFCWQELSEKIRASSETNLNFWCDCFRLILV